MHSTWQALQCLRAPFKIKWYTWKGAAQTWLAMLRLHLHHGTTASITLQLQQPGRMHGTESQRLAGCRGARRNVAGQPVGEAAGTRRSTDAPCHAQRRNAGHSRRTKTPISASASVDVAPATRDDSSTVT